MRLKKSPYVEFKSVSTTVDQYTSEESSPIFKINNVPVIFMALKGNDLISIMMPMCPQCSSTKVVKYRTFLITMENGITFCI